MKYIVLVILTLHYSSKTVSQINNAAQKKEIIRWLNERLKEAATDKKVSGIFTEYAMSNFDDCNYIKRKKTYLDYQGKVVFGSNIITVFSFAQCKQELMLKFVDDNKIWFDIGVDANDNSIQETKMDEGNKGIEKKRITSISIGPFKNDPVLSSKILKAIQSLVTYCKNEAVSTNSQNSSSNSNAIVDWLNNKIGVASKIPIQVNDGEILKASSMSSFDNCTYTIFSDLWEFTKDNIGSIGKTKQTAEMSKLDASTLTLYYEDGFAWFIIMTKGQEKAIPVYRVGKENQVIRLESYTNTISIGPFIDEPTSKEIAKKYIATLINSCNSKNQ